MALTIEKLQEKLEERKNQEEEEYHGAIIEPEEFVEPIIPQQNMIDNYKEEVSQITTHVVNQEIRKTRSKEEKWTDIDIGLEFNNNLAAQQNATVIYNSLTSPNFDINKKTHIRKSLEEAAKNEKIENFNELSDFEKTLIKHPKAFARMLCEFDEKGTSIDQNKKLDTRTLFSSLKTHQGQLGLIKCCEALNARESENKVVQGVKDFFNKLSVVIANVMEAPFKGALKNARKLSTGDVDKSHVKELANQISGTGIDK